jgi:hypothetical protein
VHQGNWYSRPDGDTSGAPVLPSVQTGLPSRTIDGADIYGEVDVDECLVDEYLHTSRLARIMHL